MLNNKNDLALSLLNLNISSYDRDEVKAEYIELMTFNSLSSQNKDLSPSELTLEIGNYIL